MEAALASCGSTFSDLARVCSTGYGRHNVKFAHATRTEIACHSKAAHFAFPKAITVVDVGGQDNKIIHLDAEGRDELVRRTGQMAVPVIVVGDEAVVTWTVERGLHQGNCLRCVFLVTERIHEQKDRYLARYGIVPEFKAGMGYCLLYEPDGGPPVWDAKVLPGVVATPATASDPPMPSRGAKLYNTRPARAATRPKRIARRNPNLSA